MSVLAEMIKENSSRIINSHESKDFTVITGYELLSRQCEALPMLAEGFLPRVGVSICAGMSDLGKSALLRQLAVHVVVGESFFIGFPLKPIHKKSLFISSEDDDHATTTLMHRICDGKYQPDQLEGLRFIFDSENLEVSIRESLEQEQADLVIVDCMLDFFGSKNLNAANEFRTWLKAFKKLAVEFQTQIVFLHHLGKRADEREPNKASLLGSSAIEHAPRLVFELRGGEEPNQRYLCLLKANFLPSETKGEAHELRFENMRFSSTGIRKPSYEIVKRSPERSPEQREQLKEKVRELGNAKKSQREIAKELGISLGSVNEYLRQIK